MERGHSCPHRFTPLPKADKNVGAPTAAEFVSSRKRIGITVSTNSGPVSLGFQVGDDAAAVSLAVSDWTPYEPPSLAMALDASNLVWSTGTNAPWIGQEIVTHDGVAAAQSGEVWYPELSTLSTIVEGSGNLNFWWKVTFPGTYVLGFFVDDRQQLAMAADTWTPQSFYLVWSAKTRSMTQAGRRCLWFPAMGF